MNLRPLQRNVPFLATATVCLLLYVAASLRYKGFASLAVFVNFFGDNAFLGIAAIGMTFVILSGGIDLSVGGLAGLISVLCGVLIEKHHVHPAICLPILLLIGLLFGSAIGAVIQFFALPPFLVTLAGMFLARGLAYALQLESIQIRHYFDAIEGALHLPLGSRIELRAAPVIFLSVFAAALWIAHWTRFGRNIYAIGGNEQSALLMGLPVARSKVAVYALSGLCSALVGIVYSLDTLAANPNALGGLELDAIAAVVIGGTLLSGGVGYVAGTMVGLLILAIIQTAIAFDGRLNSWWTRIAIGVLLLAFILLQKLIQAKKFRTAKTFQTTA
jgi:ribose/xylose/arabinose/galactoside ABC-type transport system permease subunit